ncbi:hypothetical protein KXS07_27125 [Inquilinus limosus]|uniref:hypothetical protein n=1 Tax=Inquilinus limosus TaxID=171674 RepID=UPI003F1398EB
MVVTNTVKEVIFSLNAGGAVLLLKNGGQMRSAEVGPLKPPGPPPESSVVCQEGGKATVVKGVVRLDGVGLAGFSAVGQTTPKISSGLLLAAGLEIGRDLGVHEVGVSFAVVPICGIADELVPDFLIPRRQGLHC